MEVNMETFVVIYFIVVFLLFVGVYLHQRRNNKVYDFLIEVVDEVAWYNMQVNIKDWLEYPRVDKVYNKMLYSFKPLRMDVWFPEINRKVYKEKFNQILDEDNETKKG